MIPLTDIAAIALTALRANKMRSFLTMLGVIIGVASVIVMVSISAGARSSISQFIEGLGTNLLTITPGSGGQPGRSGGAGTANPFSERDIAALKDLPDVIEITGSLSTSAPVIYGNANWTTTVTGAHETYLGIRDWVLDDGRNFTAQEARAGAKVAIIGSTPARELFGGSNPVGQRIRVKRVPFTVIGVLQEKGQSGFGQDQDDTLIVPIAAARNRLLGRSETVPDQVQFIQAKIASAEALEVAEAEIKELLRKRRSIRAGASDDFAVRNMAEFVRARRAAMETFGILLAATASVALVVGGIGIMNIMLVSVTERTREIGLRMAVGARRRVILAQFLGESVALCLIGGLIGFILGAGLAVLMSAVGGWDILIDWRSALLGLGASAAVGVFFGYYPARKASLLNPIVALRFE